MIKQLDQISLMTLDSKFEQERRYDIDAFGALPRVDLANFEVG